MSCTTSCNWIFFGEFGLTGSLYITPSKEPRYQSQPVSLLQPLKTQMDAAVQLFTKSHNIAAAHGKKWEKLVTDGPISYDNLRAVNVTLFRTIIGHDYFASTS